VAVQAQREQLILNHLPLVRHIVARLLVRLPAGVDVENLEAAGALGLVEAASRYDADRGVPFDRFAASRIRGAVLDELRRNCPLSQQMLEQVAQVRRAYETLPAGASVADLATATAMSPEEVADCLAAMRLARMTGNEGETTLLDRQEGRAEDRPDVQAESSEERQLLALAIEGLPERERLVLTMYYREDLRLKEIGELLNLSESRVCRLLNMALFNAGEYLRARQK